jgi:competence protein ComFC
MTSYPQKGMPPFLTRLLDLLFPEKCLSCGEKGSPLCKSCVSYLPVAEPLSGDLYACLSYHNDTTRDALWRLKYKKKIGIAHSFAGIMLEHAIELLSEIRSFEPGEINPFLVIPIPLSPARLRERGYNQADLITRDLCSIAPKNILEYAPSVLVKTRETPSQVSVHARNERLKNLRGCFAVSAPAAARGKDVVLVDDIITTGATMEEARKALKRAGARRVIGLAVAH